MKPMLVAITAASLLGSASSVDGAIRQAASPLAGLAPANASDAPGCAIGVSASRKEQYAAWGLADIDHAVPISRDTVFHAASLAKQFTAYSIGRLVEDRRLRLNDDVRRYLPELPDYGRPITIGHLVHHTSGLRDQGALLFLSGWRSDDRVTRSDALRAIFRQRGLNFLPGEQDLYNNSGYTLLGEIVARVTGRSLADYAQEVIFRPLKLHNSRFYDDPALPQPGRARAYRPVGQAWRLSEPRMEVYGASNLMTTAEDLLIWQRHLLSPSTEARPIVEWLRRSGMLTDGSLIGYGGGLYLGHHRGRSSFGHDGLDGGYSARTLAIPSMDLAIAILCNSGPEEPDRLIEALLNHYLPPLPRTPRKSFPLRHDLAIAGLYWSPDTDAVMELYADPEGNLSRRSPPGRFRETEEGLLEIDGQRWRLEPGLGGRPPSLLALFDPLPPRRFELIVDPSPADAKLEVLAGTYSSDEQAISYEVTIQGNQLAIGSARISPILLSPAGRDRFFSATLGTVTFNRIGKSVTGLTISQRRAWRVSARRVNPAEQ